ncbi:probable LRR receptor-like serine/threonine-protein kinase At3g47570 [Vigna unguiculata]|uniref:probable LRR receptor-like serine/threonine-protein kinase At3g47570 n=1 Tax=Vigna unguiculata TaxID=3917 RepID=UPI0010171F9A|nr:probable LRR receptor-like serine/threonine-protein kinase At3g47570 [Vigna unguiculata]
MKYFCRTLLTFWSILIHLFSLSILKSIWFTPNITVFASGNETEHLALLKFKESISNDPSRIMLSWNTSTHFCNWHGITCNSVLQRVTELNLKGYKLKGFISPYVGNLSHMTYFNIGNNSFYGEIPHEIGKLSKLQYLSVANNLLLEGKFPSNLTACTGLKILHLYGNNLTGEIPVEILSLQKLQQLILWKNNFSGRIPSFMGNLSSLIYLSLSVNNFNENIPQEICRLKRLTFLSLDINKLTGVFPSCLYNMSSLTVFSANQNQLNGSLPSNMFHTLSNLQALYIDGNQISGPIPSSIANASTLSILGMDDNNIYGQVPSMGKQRHLQSLTLGLNNLGDNSPNDLEFLKSLTNCSELQVLSLAYNNFGGRLPNSLGNLSTKLSELYLGGNQISGDIPATCGNLIGLILFTMERNLIHGIIPITLAKLQKLQVLDLRGNKLSSLGTFIGNLSRLYYLDVAKNMLQGSIPPSLGNCQDLQHLDLSQNNLTGTIPLQVFNLSSLATVFSLSQNFLSGNIPEEVGNLKNLNSLYLYENRLSGHIPKTIGECIMLEELYLNGNSLQGSIPSSLASLRGLQSLDLSRNLLSGSIPSVLQSISLLQYFNVSFNMLDGEVPTKGIFSNASGIIVTGNSNLCGGISKLHLPLCPAKATKQARHHSLRLIAIIVSVVASLLILLVILTIYWMRKRSNKPSLDSPTIDQLPKVSYQSLYNGTNGFSSSNLIGSGSFSSVYKGTLEQEDKIVAIKVLNLQKKGADKSFIVECNALKNIRHRNLVPTLTCCSSTDYKGQEFKAIIFEYMTNGNLEQWIHPETPSAQHMRRLSLHQRLNITIDVASALHYLHHECEQLIIHCDIKPSNVLLNDSMVAHVGDFGIARLLSTFNHTTSGQTSTNGIKGTVGYAPPEYGERYKVSTYGDVYSFGILILEMLTGRRPTDEMFKDGQNLRNFVAVSIPNNLLQILDQRIISEYEATAVEGNCGNLNAEAEKCVVSLFRIGLACSVESPKERMNLVDVIRELNQITKVSSLLEMTIE